MEKINEVSSPPREAIALLDGIEQSIRARLLTELSAECRRRYPDFDTHYDVARGNLEIK